MTAPKRAARGPVATSYAVDAHDRAQEQARFLRAGVRSHPDIKQLADEIADAVNGVVPVAEVA